MATADNIESRWDETLDEALPVPACVFWRAGEFIDYRLEGLFVGFQRNYGYHMLRALESIRDLALYLRATFGTQFVWVGKPGKKIKWIKVRCYEIEPRMTPEEMKQAYDAR